jgi:hypothetical protein
MELDLMIRLTHRLSTPSCTVEGPYLSPTIRAYLEPRWWHALFFGTVLSFQHFQRDRDRWFVVRGGTRSTKPLSRWSCFVLDSIWTSGRGLPSAARGR